MREYFPLKRFIHDQRGSNAVEAAFCFPIVILLVFACFQYAVFFQNSSEINHRFDSVSRQIVLLEDPSKSEIESVMKEKFNESDVSGISYDVVITEKYDQEFANISVNYAYKVSLPFALDYAMKTRYQNMVMLTKSFE